MGRAWGVLVALTGCADPPPVSSVGVELELARHRSCADPSRRAEQGFDRFVYGEARATRNWNWGGGVMAGDLDGDGALELVLPVEPGVVILRWRDGAIEVDRDTFGGFDLAFATGGSIVDVDADGDLDVYVTRTLGDPIADEASDGRNHLLRNRGDGTFEDVTDEAGVDGCTAPAAGTRARAAGGGERACWRSMASSWGDVDGDLDLDLYVGNYGWVDETEGTTQEMMGPGEPDALYLNRGDGTFEDASAELPEEIQDGYTYAGGFVDLDDDGDLDLYVVNDFGNKYPNRVAWNEGGRLVVRKDDDSGLVQSMTGMGMGVGELDGDGRPDLAIAQWGRNTLFLSAAGRWIDWAESVGYAPANDGRDQRVAWGSEFGDVDNDADLDLLTTYGHLTTANPVWRNPVQQPDALFVNEPDGDGGLRFVDRGAELVTADPNSGRGGLFVDLDGDGWLDLVTRHLDGPDDLLLARCGEARSLVVRPRMPGTPNPFAVGAKIDLVGPGVHATRWLTAGGTGFASAGPPEVHFGVGSLDEVSLVVRWPDGEVSSIGPVATGGVLTVTRGAP